MSSLLSPDLLAKALGVLFAILLAGVLALGGWAVKRLLTWMREWVEWENARKAQAEERSKMLERFQEFALLVEGTEESPGICARLESVEQELDQLQKDLGLDDDNLRTLRVEAIRRRVSPPSPEPHDTFGPVRPAFDGPPRLPGKRSDDDASGED